MFLVFGVICCFLWTGSWDLAVEEKSEKTGVTGVSEESEDAKRLRKSLKL